MSDELLIRLLEKVENRYYGKYRGFVYKNDDPKKMGRLRLRIPGVLGDKVVSGWAMPCAPYGGKADQGFFFIPEEGAGVWVEFEAGNLEYPIWVGTFWCTPGGSTEVPKPGDEQTPPTSKIIKTLKHTIELAEKDDDVTLRITDSNDNTITVDKDGMRIESSKDVNVKDSNNNVITLDKDGMKLQAAKDIALKADGDIKMTAANVKVTVSGSMDIS